MRLQITSSFNAKCFYVVKSVYYNGKKSNRVAEKLGNLEKVTKKANGQDPIAWAKQYVEQLNREDACIKLLRQQKGELTEFSEALWCRFVDFAPVCPDDRMTFTFKTGQTIEGWSKPQQLILESLVRKGHNMPHTLPRTDSPASPGCRFLHFPAG